MIYSFVFISVRLQKEYMKKDMKKDMEKDMEKHKFPSMKHSSLN